MKLRKLGAIGAFLVLALLTTTQIMDRLNGTRAGLAVEAPTETISTTNITLSGEQAVNGVAVVDGDRVFVTGQTDETDNGIYVASTSGGTPVATPSEYSLEALPIIDIRTYGYVVDDSTDDAAAFNKAIDAAGVLGGAIIQLPPGTGNLASSIIVDVPNVVFRGAGRGTIVQALTSSFSLFQPRAANIEFRSFSLYGAASATGEQWGIFTQQAYASTRLKAIDMYFGGWASSSRLNDGIKFDEDWDDGLVERSVFDEMQGEDRGGGYNVLAGAVDRLKVHHNMFFGAAGRGRHSVYLSTGARYSEVTDNMSFDMNHEHMTINSYCNQPANEHNVFADNIIVGGNPANSSTGAISLWGKSAYNKIRGNLIYNPGFYGIIVQALNVTTNCDSLDNEIENNTIVEAGTIGIEISGSTRTMIRDNIVHNSSRNAADVSPNIRLKATGLAGQAVTNATLIGNRASGGRSALNFNATVPLPTGTKIQGNTWHAGTVATVEDSGVTYDGAKGSAATIDNGKSSVLARLYRAWRKQ